MRVFENMVLREIFGPKSVGVTGEWRRLHSEKLYDLYSSPNIVRLIMERRMRWEGHVARMGGEERCIQGLGKGDVRERDHVEDPGVDGRIILRWIFRRWDVGVWTGLRLRIGAVGGLLL